MAFPSSAHLVLGEAKVVGGGVDRLGAVNSDHDDLPNRICHAALLVRGDHPVIKGPGVEDRRNTLEAVALAHQRVDDIYLDDPVLSEVRECSRRTNVRENEMFVV